MMVLDEEPRGIRQIIHLSTFFSLWLGIIDTSESELDWYSRDVEIPTRNGGTIKFGRGGYVIKPGSGTWEVQYFCTDHKKSGFELHQQLDVKWKETFFRVHKQSGMEKALQREWQENMREIDEWEQGEWKKEKGA